MASDLEAPKAYAAIKRDIEITVGQNIDNKIARLKAEIAELEESKVKLAPLLDMKINQLREAMQY